MSEHETTPPAPPAPAARDAAIVAVLAPVPATPIATTPQWIDTAHRAVDPKSLY